MSTPGSSGNRTTLSGLLSTLTPEAGDEALTASLAGADWSAVTDDDLRALRRLLYDLEHREGVGRAHQIASEHLLTARRDWRIIHPGHDFSDFEAWALSPDRRHLAAATDSYGNSNDYGELTVWETATGRCVSRVGLLAYGVGSGEDDHSIAWHPDGQRLVTTYESGDLGIFAPFVDSPGRTLEWSSEELYDSSASPELEWSPDGRWLAVLIHDLTPDNRVTCEVDHEQEEFDHWLAELDQDDDEDEESEEDDDEDADERQRHALPLALARVHVSDDGTGDGWTEPTPLCWERGVDLDIPALSSEHRIFWSVDGHYLAAGGRVFALTDDEEHRAALSTRQWSTADFVVDRATGGARTSSSPTPAASLAVPTEPMPHRMRARHLADDGETVVAWHERALCFWEAATGRVRGVHTRWLGGSPHSLHHRWGDKGAPKRPASPLRHGQRDFGNLFPINPALPLLVDGTWTWAVAFPSGLVVCPPRVRERMISQVSYVFGNRLAWPLHWGQGTGHLEVHDDWSTALGSPLLPETLPAELRRQLGGVPDPDWARGLQRVSRDRLRPPSWGRLPARSAMPESLLVTTHALSSYVDDRSWLGAEVTPELLRSLAGTVVRLTYQQNTRVATLLAVDDRGVTYLETNCGTLVDHVPFERILGVATVSFKRSGA